MPASGDERDPGGYEKAERDEPPSGNDVLRRSVVSHRDRVAAKEDSDASLSPAAGRSPSCEGGQGNPKTRLVRKNPTFVVNLSDIYCNHRAVDALSRGIQRCSLPCHRSQLAGAETPVILTGVSFQGDGSAWERRLDARGGYFRGIATLRARAARSSDRVPASTGRAPAPSPGS